MSIVRAKTNEYGPATIDIQIEQGADFYLPMTLTRGGSPWVLTNCTLDAHFSAAWSPGQECHDLVVTVVNAEAGTISVKFPSADSLSLSLPSQPRKAKSPEKFQLGGWVLNILDPTITESPNKRIVEGIVYLDRDPCLA